MSIISALGPALLSSVIHRYTSTLNLAHCQRRVSHSRATGRNTPWATGRSRMRNSPQAACGRIWQKCCEIVRLIYGQKYTKFHISICVVCENGSPKTASFSPKFGWLRKKSPILIGVLEMLSLKMELDVRTVWKKIIYKPLYLERSENVKLFLKNGNNC